MRTTAAAKLLLQSSVPPLLLLLAACATAPGGGAEAVASTQGVADLGAYRSYAFMPGPGGSVVARPGGLGSVPAEDVDAGIRRAIETTLARKGLIAAPAADLIVAYSLGAVRRVTAEQADRVFVPPGDPWFGVGPDPVAPWQFELLRVPVTEGTLAVEMFDARTGHEVWRGHATGRLTRPALGNRGEAGLVEAVERAAGSLLNRYPARGAGGAAKTAATD